MRLRLPFIASLPGVSAKHRNSWIIIELLFLAGPLALLLVILAGVLLGAGRLALVIAASAVTQMLIWHYVRQIDWTRPGARRSE